MRERKPFDQRLKTYLDELADLAQPNPVTNEDRVRLARERMNRALEKRESIPGLPNGVETRNVTIGSGISGRIYRPSKASRPIPTLIYLHGGGWVMGSIATHDPFCRLLSEAAEVAVLSVEYRLAPEYPFPAGLEDAFESVAWAQQHFEQWNGDPGRFVLGGDSAGANLAAVAANEMHAKMDMPKLAALLLLYPVTDHPGSNHPSYTENATGYGLEAETMHWLWEQYAPTIVPGNPLVSPLQSQHVPPLPPTLITTAEYDALRDEGIAYVEKLKAANVKVTHLHSPDMNHNFPVHPGTVARFPQSQAALAEIAGWLRGR
jgi:acetyl esterase